MTEWIVIGILVLALIGAWNLDIEWLREKLKP